MKQVTLEVKEMYRLIIGHDGFTSGCGYDGDDQWSETYFGESHFDICKQVAEKHTSINPGNEFRYEFVEVLVYEGEYLMSKFLNDYTIFSEERTDLINFFNKNDAIQEIITATVERKKKEIKDKKEAAAEKHRIETEKKERETLAYLQKKFAGK